MSRLDRYVARVVFGAFGAALLFFLFLAVIMDLLGNMPRYSRIASEKEWGWFELTLKFGAYYIRLLPVLFVMITPFVTVIACMFSVARLQNANEVVPMLFVGRPMQRVLRPMLFCGLLAGCGMAACWQWVVPQVASSLAELDGQLNTGSSTQRNLVDEWEKDGLIWRLSIGEFQPAEQKLTNLYMLVEAVLWADNVLFEASAATWDEEQGDWRLENGWRKTSDAEVAVAWLGRSDLPPSVLLQRGRETIEADIQSYTELAQTMASRPNRADVRLAFHRHITYPFANLILLFIALPLAVWFERGGRIGRVMTAIGLCGLYALFDLVCQSLARQGHLHPVVGAWSPAIVFGALGIVLFGGMRT